MVNILKKVPGFGERLGAAVGGGLGQGFQQGMSKAQEFAEKMQQAQAKSLPKMQEAQLKQQKEQQEKEQETAGLKDALDWLDENYEYAGDPLVPGKSFLGGVKKGERHTIFDLPFNRKAAQTREEIDNTGFWTTDKIYTHFNKGQISNVKLKLIQEKLAPHSGLSEREYKARVSALRRIANLPPDAPKYVVDNMIEREVKTLNKIEGAKSSKKEKERPPLESFHG
jgi:hypothetical protein